VSALREFCSSGGAQNTVQCKSQCVKMPPIVSKLKGGKNVFSDTVHGWSDKLCRLTPTCPFHLPFPPFSDFAEAQSYSASTVI
jgi:hypothetical protein